MEDLGVESSMAKELGNERSVGSERSSEEVEEGGEETDPWRSKTRNEIGARFVRTHGERCLPFYRPCVSW